VRVDDGPELEWQAAHEFIAREAFAGTLLTPDATPAARELKTPPSTSTDVVSQNGAECRNEEEVMGGPWTGSNEGEQVIAEMDRCARHQRYAPVSGGGQRKVSKTPALKDVVATASRGLPAGDPRRQLCCAIRMTPTREPLAQPGGRVSASAGALGRRGARRRAAEVAVRRGVSHPVAVDAADALGCEEAGVYDHVLVDKLHYVLAEPRRWELAAFKPPLQQRDAFVKRVVGMPGERINIGAATCTSCSERGAASASCRCAGRRHCRRSTGRTCIRRAPWRAASPRARPHAAR
jgi:hypothetical protein